MNHCLLPVYRLNNSKKGWQDQAAAALILEDEKTKARIMEVLHINNHRTEEKQRVLSGGLKSGLSFEENKGSVWCGVWGCACSLVGRVEEVVDVLFMWKHNYKQYEPNYKN